MVETVETKPNEEHAFFSPSGADRWAVCTGSVLLEKIIPPSDKPEPEGFKRVREHGQRSHAMFEKFMKNEPVIDSDDSERTYALRSSEIVKNYLGRNHVKRYLSEQRLTIDNKFFGTSDLVAENDDTYFIIDYKTFLNEKARRVPAAYNTQLIIYAYMLGKPKPKPNVVLAIIRNQQIDEWCTDWSNIVRLMQPILKAREEVLANAYRFKQTTKGCMFCKNKEACPLSDKPKTKQINSSIDTNLLNKFN